MIREIKLLCIPYAGEMGAVYYKWRKFADYNIEIIPIEMKGRGKRSQEPFDSSVKEVVQDILLQIGDSIFEGRYAIFGHSMGSIIAFELVHELQKKMFPLPMHIFFSGCMPPENMIREKKICDIPDKEFKNEIIRLGGVPKEVRDNDEIFSLFLPILRADYKVVDEYVYSRHKEKIHCNISVFYGEKDYTCSGDLLLDWKKYTDYDMNVYSFFGGHFFIVENMQRVVETINEVLLEQVR